MLVILTHLYSIVLVNKDRQPFLMIMIGVNSFEFQLIQRISNLTFFGIDLMKIIPDYNEHYILSNCNENETEYHVPKNDF